MSKEERLQKVLARHGFGSRREIERWIIEERIRVNGHIATLGLCLKVGDRVTLNNKNLNVDLSERFPTQLLAYNKPVGEVSTRKDEKGRPTVFDTLPRLREGRWVMVGRLDVNTSGLLLFTNDGEFAARLMHPSYALEREYAVRVIGEVTENMYRRLKEGVLLEDGMARFESVELIGGTGANRWYRVVLKEGRYREVRRLWEALNVTVNRLIRVRYGVVSLPRDLRMGHHRFVAAERLQELAKSIGYRLVEAGYPAVLKKKKVGRRPFISKDTAGKRKN